MQLKPEVQFAKTSDGVRIAFAVHGEGPPLVYVRALNSHVERWWTRGSSSGYFRALSRSFSVVLFDARGNGMSDPTETITLEGAVEDLRAVIKAAELEHVTLYGQGFGSPVALAYAGRFPDDVARLLLYCAYMRGSATVITDEFIQTLRTMPAAAAAFMARQSYPDDDELPSRLLDRLDASPDTAAKYFEFARAVNVEEDVAKVRAPTLVMQPQRNPQIRSELGREVAADIPGARFIAIEGGAYNPFARMSFEPTLLAIGEFVGHELVGVGRAHPVVLMLTDMVDSTAMTQRLGEEVSRVLHEEHDVIVRDALVEHDGEVVQHTGDGIMSSFDTVAEALACAVTIQATLSARNETTSEPIRVRIGIAAGEAYDHTGQPFGTAAQLVTRVAGKGHADEILVSDAVRELASGQGFEFGPARSVRLKGFPGRSRIHEVVWAR